MHHSESQLDGFNSHSDGGSDTDPLNTDFEVFKKKILEETQHELELLKMEVEQREELLWNVFLFGHTFVQDFFSNSHHDL